MGAIAFGGVRVLNREVIDDLGVGQEAIDAVAAHEERELRRRETLYREGRPLLDVRGQRAILIDDGLATGSTMLAAARALRRLGPARIVVAVPVSAADTCAAFRHEVDEVVCAMTPESFVAVGLWYRDFSQTSDEEVRQLLARAAAQQPAPQLYRSAVPLPSH
jgi:predicted phosphoribosyltransferase